VLCSEDYNGPGGETDHRTSHVIQYSPKLHVMLFMRRLQKNVYSSLSVYIMIREGHDYISYGNFHYLKGIVRKKNSGIKNRYRDTANRNCMENLN